MSENLKQIASAGSSESRRKSTFYASNETTAFGTGVDDLAVNDTFVATEGLINIFNTASRSGAVGSKNQWIIPLKIQMTCRAAPASATNWQFEMVLDDIDRFTSGGEVAISKQTSRDTIADYKKRDPKARINIGALLLTAANDGEFVGAGDLDVAIPTIGDIYTIVFGGDGATDVPRVDIGPGCNLSVHAYGASHAATAGQWDIQVWYLETNHPNRV